MPDQGLRTLRVVWTGIFLSVILFFVVSRVLYAPGDPLDPGLFPFFVLAALGAAVASFVLPARMHREGTRSVALDTREAPGVVTPDAPNTLRRVFVDPEKARGTAWRVFQAPFIVSIALSEGVALVGLGLSFRGFPLERVLPFFVLSLVLLAWRFPTAGAVEKALEKSAGAAFPLNGSAP